MAHSTSALPENEAFASHQFSEDSHIWHNLKHAIASSSGFQRWSLERHLNLTQVNTNLDEFVSLYLRETLETLAY